MSTNKTTNYQLHAWETGDKFLRTEINENFGAIDTALGAKAAQSALEALSATVAGKADSGTVAALQAVVAGKVEVVFGNYVGDNQSSRIISLGFTPRAVLVSGHSNTFIASGIAYGGFALSGSLGGNTGTTLLNVVTGGFQVFINSISLNGSNYKYSYMAIR